ncbi:MAG: ABC transporter permease [Nocardioidaceae bacterium]|nr:ABC transporter permease [Nocardioidaceae bacterium]
MTQATVGDRDPLGPLKPPGDTTGLFGVFRRRYLLKLLVQKELRVRYAASLLGLGWSYMKPLIRFAMYYFVIGVLLNLRGAIPLFALHIFAAMIMVHFFTETLNAGTKSVVKNKSLVRKMNVPREMFPVASVTVTTYHMIPQYVVLVVACLFLSWSPDPAAIVAGVLGIAIMLSISLTVALAFSALNVSFRDIGNFVETIGMMVLWSAPQLYPWTFVEDVLGGTVWEQVYLANPVAVAVLLNQRAFWIPSIDEDTSGFMPDDLLLRGGITLFCCLLLVGAAQWLFARLETSFAEKL